MKVKLLFLALSIFCIVFVYTIWGSRLLAQGSQTITILAVGDSLTQSKYNPPERSYPAYLENHLRARGYDVRVVNAGVEGNTTAELLERLPKILENIDPDIAILVIGGNDGLRRLPVSSIEKNIADMIELLQKDGAQIVLPGLAPRGILLPGSYGDEFSRIYQRLAEKYEVIYIRDFFFKIQQKSGYFYLDQIHPNPKGNKYIAKKIWNFLMASRLLGNTSR